MQTLTPAPLRDFAIIVNAADNVAVAKTGIPPELDIALGDGRVVRTRGPVTPGNRFATRAIPAGEFVRQYGQPIGTSRGIVEGDAVTHANMSNDVPVVRDLDPELVTPPPAYLAEADRPTFRGFRRADGRVGTRNFVLVVPTSMCASHEASQIATIAEFTVFSRERFPNVDGVVAIPHNKGCGCQDGSTIEIMLRTLGNYADHPNVGGVVFIGLGCEKTNLTVMERFLAEHGHRLRKPTVRIGIQEAGGTESAVTRGVEAVTAMLPVVNQAARSDVVDRRTHARREVRRLGRVFGALRQPEPRLRRRPPHRRRAARCSSPRCRSSAAPSTSSRCAPRTRRPGGRSTRWWTGTRATPPSSARSSTRIRARATSPAGC